MKDSSRSIKNDDDEARRTKRKSKKRRRDRSVSIYSSDSDDSYSRRKRRRKEAKKKRARRPSSDEDSTVRKKRRKGSRRSEGEYRKRASKVKQKRRRIIRSRRDSSSSSSSSLSESCSTCRECYSSEEESGYERSRKTENARGSGSKCGELGKMELVKGGGRKIDGHSVVTSSSCSGCRANGEEILENAPKLMKRGNGDQERDDKGFAVSQFFEDGVTGKGDNCFVEQANPENLSSESFGAEDAIERKTIEESERWEMGAEYNITFVDSSNIMFNPDENSENGEAPHSPNVAHDERGSQHGFGNPHQDEHGSNCCLSGGKDDTSTDIDCPDSRNLEAILRQKALERFRNKQHEKVQCLVEEPDNVGGPTLAMAKNVGEGTERLSCVQVGKVAESSSINLPEKDHYSRTPGVEECGRVGGKARPTYSDSLQGRKIMSSSIHVSTVCNYVTNNCEGTAVSKAGQGASGNNSASDQNESQRVPRQIPLSRGSPTTMLRGIDDLQKESIEKTGPSPVRNGVDALGASGCASVASGGPHSAHSNFDQNGSKSKTVENSQFEQKTMSVMRGGEMVQVSYKVYIPKKAPALSRRQLQR